MEKKAGISHENHNYCTFTKKYTKFVWQILTKNSYIPPKAKRKVKMAIYKQKKGCQASNQMHTQYSTELRKHQRNNAK